MNTNLIPLREAVVIRGQRAWTRIKATAAEQRQLWKEIGEALRYGRALHKADRAFAQWVKVNGFDDMARQVRADAMWLAENWTEVSDGLTPDLSNPQVIRKWFNEQAKDTPPAPELTIEAPTRLTASIEQVAPVAAKVNKLAAMAERGGGQEQKTAQKYLAKKAKDMGMEPEELVTLSRKLEPAREVPASAQPVLENTIKEALEIAVDLADFIQSTQTIQGATALSREFAISLVIKALDARGVK